MIAVAEQRRRRASRPPERPAASRVKCTILLSPEADIRLDVHAKMSGVDRSVLVEQLIREHLRRYVVQDRGQDRAKVESSASVEVNDRPESMGE